MMINQASGFEPSANRFSAKAAVAPVACLVALCGTLALSMGEPKSLEANSTTPGVDLDVDGLDYQQEYLLGTDDSEADTDMDGFSDLEELARGSDPLLDTSLPGSAPFSTSVYAYSDAGILYFQAAVYVKGSDISELRLQSGFVGKMGQSFIFGPDVMLKASFFSKAASDPSDLLTVMKLPIPVSFISKLGQLNLFVRLEDQGSMPAPGSVGAMTVVDSSGVMVEIQGSPASVQEGDGVIYRPLGGPNDPAPSTADTGQVCWQSTLPVSSSGNLIQFQIQSSSCQDFDAFCDATACAASFGGSVQLIDPGSLLGG